MKKFGLFLLVALFVSLNACDDDDDPVTPLQEVTCAVTAPEDAAIVNLRETSIVQIKGEGSVNVGQVEKAVLKVDGQVIPEVTNVPFTFDYTFPADQAAVPCKIELTVSGDAGAVKSDKIIIGLIKTDQRVSCALTAPADGTEICMDDTPSVTISGDGDVNVGTVAGAVLKVNGKMIPEVTTVPFSYEYTFAADQKVGPMLVELTVTGDEGAVKKVSNTLLVTKKEQQVTCELTAPVEGTVIDLAKTQTLDIAGKVGVNIGSVASKKLIVGGKEITPFPELQSDGTFTYTYTLAPDQAAGNLVVLLEVKGDRHEVAHTKSVTVKLEKTEVIPSVETFVDERDGKTYKMVTIGNQTWMAENLAYLPQVNSPSQDKPSSSWRDKHYFVLNYDGKDVVAAKATQEYKKHGVLYTWCAAAVGESGSSANPSGLQGVCPKGWHLPSQAEWKALSDYVATQVPNVKGNGQEELDPLTWMPTGNYIYDEDCKNVWGALAAPVWGETSMGHENPDLLNGPQNTFGMNIVPAGSVYRNSPNLEGSWFNTSNTETQFWTSNSTSYGAGLVTFSVNDYLPKTTKSTAQGFGYSVRCVKD